MPSASLAKSLVDSVLAEPIQNCLLRAPDGRPCLEARSPVDLERMNAHNWHGTCHGGDMGPSQSGGLRFAPRSPIDGLYLTGGTRVTLPGGEVVKAAELSGASNMLFRRNSQSGAVEALQRSGTWGGLNEVLHANQ